MKIKPRQATVLPGGSPEAGPVKRASVAIAKRVTELFDHGKAGFKEHAAEPALEAAQNGKLQGARAMTMLWETVGPSRPLPFEAGAGGKLSPPVDFSKYLDKTNPEYADPTDATIRDKSKTLLRDYMHTGQYGEFTGEKGVTIRYAVFGPPPGVPVKGVINLVSGRTESFMKYQETLYNLRDLRAEGYVIASMDHRGQGFSGRETSKTDGTYVADFEDFVRDEKTFSGILSQHFGGDAPRTLLANSMGGAISTRYLEEHPGEYGRAVLMSPMLGINHGLPETVATVLAKTAAKLKPEGYTVKQGAWHPEEFRADNVTTNCPERQQMMQELALDYPELRSGGATWKWLEESLAVTQKLMQPEELKKLEGVDLHVLRAEGDRVVRTDTQKEFADRVGAQLRDYRFTDDEGHVQGAKHVLLSHHDELRRRVLADVRELLTAPL